MKEKNEKGGIAISSSLNSGQSLMIASRPHIRRYPRAPSLFPPLLHPCPSHPADPIDRHTHNNLVDLKNPTRTTASSTSLVLVDLDVDVDVLSPSPPPRSSKGSVYSFTHTHTNTPPLFPTPPGGKRVTPKRVKEQTTATRFLSGYASVRGPFLLIGANTSFRWFGRWALWSFIFASLSSY